MKMINNENMIKILHNPHISEKAEMLMKKYNTVVLKVDSSATKVEIKTTISRIFNVQIKKIRTLIVKGKTKRFGKYIGTRIKWKKAYISLSSGKNLDFIFSTKET